MPKFPGQRIWSRGILILGVILYVWYTSKDTKETLLAKQTEIHPRRSQSFDCSSKLLEEIRQYPGCVPKKCGRFVSDKIITSNEVDTLLRLAQRGKLLIEMFTSSFNNTDEILNRIGARGLRRRCINPRLTFRCFIVQR